jgi:octaprenyl-diphosphate synthase
MAAKLGAVIGGGSEEEVSGLAEYGKNIGIAYQIKDDLMDWKNEDKLFNLLVKKSSDPRVVFNKMEELLKSYSEKALVSLRRVKDSDSKHNLEELVRFTEFKA